MLSAGNTYHDFMKINCRKTCGMDTGKTAELITFLACLNKRVRCQVSTMTLLNYAALVEAI